MSADSVLIALFNAASSIIAADFFFSAFADKLVGKKAKKRIVSFFAFFIFFFAPLLISNSAVNMGVLIVCTYLITLNYDMRFYNKLLLTALCIAFNVAAEISAGFLIMTSFSIDFNEAKTGIYRTFGVLLSKLLVFTFFILIRAIKGGTLHGHFRKKWLSIYILPITTYLTVYVIYRSMQYYQNQVFLTNLTLASLIMLIISNMLIVKLMNDFHNEVVNENKLILAEKMIEQQQKQYQMMFEENEVIHKLRHDQKNFIIGLLSQIQNKDYDEMVKQLNAQLQELQAGSGQNICGNSVIDTIINYKISEAKKKNIKIDFHYKGLHNIQISGIDLAILLGNALDNAIEATEKIEETEKRTVELYIYLKGNQLVVIIENNVIQNVDVDHLQTEKTGNHGYGVVNMKSVVNKYTGSLSFFCEDKVFKTVIVLETELSQ